MKRVERILRVVEAKPSDVDKGIARIDPAIAEILGISNGDVVTIEGKRKTVAMAYRGGAEDENRGVVRVDGTTRRNAGVAIDEKVGVEKAVAVNAGKVSFAPTEPLKIMGGEQYLKQRLMGRVITRGDTLPINIMGRVFDLVVTAIVPAKTAVFITQDTEIHIAEKPQAEKAAKIPRVSYEDIGGLDGEIARVREMIELPLRHPEIFDKLGIEAPKGVLLHGPPGTGKTLLAKAVASETFAHFISISGPEIMSKWYGESEAQLRKKFEEAAEKAPSIIFIDEIDSIAPRRAEVTGEVERRVVAQLLTLMDGLEARGKVIVIGATNRLDAVDPALRRPGRFDREIEIGVPDRDGRRVILQIHTRSMPTSDDFDIEHLVDISHGYVGADIAALCREAAMKALRRYLPDIDLHRAGIPGEVLERLKVTNEDFRDAFREIEPSTLRDVFTEPPNVSWEDVGGMEGVKQQLKESVELPLRRPEVFARMGIRPPRGVLLYGPPGTGKTLIAKAAAKESTANFITIKGPEVFSKWVGESEKAIREIFRKARQSAPTIVFLDEIDSIASRRGNRSDGGAGERVVNQLLTSLDSFEANEEVIVLAATNRPDIIDPSILRPGRFDRLIYCPPPDTAARRVILAIHAKGVPLEGVDLDALAAGLEGYVGADIEALVREAVMLALREDIESKVVQARHFDAALELVRPSMDEDTVKYFQHISKLLEGRMARRRKDEVDVSYR